MFYESYGSERKVPHPKELRPNHYTQIERDLSQLLSEIWENRIAIDQNDLFALRLFAEKRVSPDPSKIRKMFEFKQLIVNQTDEDASAD